MKKYTVYVQNKDYYQRRGWYSAVRRQSNEELETIITEREAHTYAVYKVKDNKTGEIVATNA